LAILATWRFNIFLRSSDAPNRHFYTNLFALLRHLEHSVGRDDRHAQFSVIIKSPDQQKDSAVELSHEEVRRIAELAKLELTDAEVTLYAGQLSDVLSYFQRLQAVDTSHIPPTASVLPLKNVFRADQPKTPLSPEEVVANAADSLDNQFRVHAVFGDD